MKPWPRGAAFVALLLAVALGVAVLFRDRLRAHEPEAQPAPSTSSSAMPAPTVVRAVQLEGRILAASGDPVNGAHVHVIVGAHVVADADTDSAGHFSFDRLPAGRARIDAEHDPEGAVRSAPVTIASAPQDLVLVLAPAAIDGTVIDDDGHPVQGASLSLEGVPFDVAAIASDAGGAFHFGAAPFESTAVVAVANGYRTARASLGPREDRAEPPVRIVLHAAAPIEGDVVDADGDPVHARVVACSGSPQETVVDTNDDGTFRLPPSAIGCTAFATHEAMAPSDPVTVSEGARLRLRLGAAGAIAGFVVDERGSRIDAFSVGIEAFTPSAGSVSAPGGMTPFTRGVFRLEKLTPGTYVLTAAAPGFPPARSSVLVVRAGAVTDRVTITLARGGAVEGRVVDEQNVPVADVELRFDLVSSATGSDAVAKTDSSGRYRLEGAPAGLFTVSARKDGFKTRLVSALTVASGASVTRDIVLTHGSGFQLTGIGAQLKPNGNAITFAGVFPGNPADVAGLRPGDRVLRIDGEDITGLSLADAIQHLRGEPGTVVGITVERGGDTIELTITRGEISQ